MAALLLKKGIERGSVTLTGTDVTKTITLVTPLTDVSKTVLLFSQSVDSGGAQHNLMTGRVLSTTQIQFERSATGLTAIIVEYEVIEYSQGITVQHLTFQQNATTVSTTITSVDTSKTFAILTARSLGMTLDGADLIYPEITSSTNLNTVAQATTASCFVAVQVIQIDDATVQKITTTYGTGATKDITVSAIVEVNTFWFFGLSGTTTPNNDDIPYLSYINSTTLRFTRTDTTSDDFGICLYVVSLSTGIKVQNIATTIASSAASVSPSIASVTVNNTAIVASSLYNRYASCNDATQEVGNTCMALSGLTATQFTATRALSPALAATTNVQVLEFVPYIPESHDVMGGVGRGVGSGVM